MNSKNVRIIVTNKEAVLTIDLTKTFGPSASGKTETIAICREEVVDGITIQVNAWKKVKK